MALNCPEEIDVFTIPHSRMKELVNKNLHLLTDTNFSNVHHLTNLLGNLRDSFQEFRTHEQIENKYIMRKLKDKLSMLSIRSSAVCNCHSDNKLSEMLQLLQDGYKCTEKSEIDRINYGIKLRSALEDFTKKFIPHMEEEEKVFQPMLIKYFSFDELKAIKSKVIKKHLEKDDIAENEIVIDDSSDDEEKLTVSSQLQRAAIDVLPDEVILQVLQYLNPQQLGRCAQASKRWNRLSFDGSLWRVLRLAQYVKGNWSLSDSTDIDEEESHLKETEDLLAELKYDEDADIDESEDSNDDDDSVEIRQIQAESKRMTLMVHCLLPRVGHHVKECYLAYSRGLQNGLLYKILQLCPNIEVLDLTHSFISDIGFKSLGKNGSGRKLRKVNLTGCKNITDKTLLLISSALGQALSYDVMNQSDDQRQTLGVDRVHIALKSACDWLEDNLMASTLYEMIENESMPQSWTNFNSRYIDSHLELSSAYLLCLDIIKTLNSHRSYENFQRSVFPGCIRQRSTLAHSDHSNRRYNECSVQRWQNERTNATCSRSVCDNMCDKDNDVVCGLEYLSLSGCHRITDTGISSLIENGCLPHLCYLDLSGCVNITSQGLTAVIKACPALDHTNLYYCDYMMDDPCPNTASGCQNLECQTRYCCRTGN